MSNGDFDYIVVGSGAGGGPLAANLAKAGFRVLLIEAGGDPCSADETGRLMYEVPIFHGRSTEYPACSWNYFVRHYTDEAQQATDKKAETVNGQQRVWYPRAGALGGCTAHNAMITVVPQNEDWDYIANITGDESWRGEKMRGYFERLERCQYVAPPGSVRGTVANAFSTIAGLLKGDEDWRDWTHGHGFNGWLCTSEADPKLVLGDEELVSVLLDGVKEALKDHIGSLAVGLLTRLDPNDSRNAESSPEGLAFTPLAVTNGKRNGPREYLVRTRKETGNNLTIRNNTLATRVLFDGTRAVGVEYIDQPHVYRADPNAVTAKAPRSEVRARCEVILAGGAFNTPQLLMLSGIGPRDQLQKYGLPVVVDLPGVGRNLQDRYEIGVISKFRKDFSLIRDATFNAPKQGEAPDEYLKRWETESTGVYASNGTLIGIIRRSSQAGKNPDLYIFGLPSRFYGYFRGYSEKAEQFHNRFTWCILKARTNNTGRVELTSADPCDTPYINFQYFGDGQRRQDPDLEAVVDGMEFARDMNRRLEALGLITDEDVPGKAVATREDLRQFVRDNAWGHHASCTCKIGADSDNMAVLDSRFRVRGTQNLRVVDASVFPKIPGYFIVTAIYMASEKAFDVIQEDSAKCR